MKKIVSLFVVFIMLVTLIGCNEKHTESGKDVSASKEVDSISYETLTIEYDVEDYVENAIIVSKNDGLVYGMLDNEGKEIIPVKYDDMEFLNKDDYIDGYFDLYISCCYENMNYIFDINGKKILETEDDVDYADSIFKNAKAPVFKIYNNDNYELYNKDMVKIADYTDDNNPYHYEHIISNKCYITCSASSGFLEARTYGSVYIYDYNGNILQDFSGLNLIEEDYNYYAYIDNKCVLFLIDADADIMFERWLIEGTAYYIGESGNILSQVSMTFGEFEEKCAKEKQYNLYESNSTYKMEDLDGKPIYKERYYKKLSVAGENECVCLTDEDNSVCVFGRQGNLYAEFGIFSGSDFKQSMDSQIDLITKNGNVEVDKIYEGKESIIAVISKSSGSEIHFFTKQH